MHTSTNSTKQDFGATQTPSTKGRAHALSSASLLGLSTALIASLASCSKSADNKNQESEPPTAASVKEVVAKPCPEPVSASVVQLQEGEYQKLGVLVGDWSGKGSIEMGPNKAGVESKFSCSVAPGGVSLSCVHQAEIEGMGPMVENAMIGIDPVTQKLHWYNINTMGETHDHLGQWASPGRIEWSFAGESEGKALVEAISMDITDKNLTFRSETTVGGERASLFEGTMTR